MNLSMIKPLLMTRPYSWVGVILISIIANMTSKKILIFDGELLLDCAVGLLLWITTIFFVEHFHEKEDKRTRIPPWVPASLIFLLSLIMAFKNIFTLLLLPLMLLFVMLYALKIKDWMLSCFSFMFRGLLEVVGFLVIFFFHSNHFSNEIFPLLLTIFLITNSRNLIGDIRDVNFDRYTFPKKYGIKLSYLVSATLIILSIIILPNIYANIHVALPLVTILTLMIFVRNAYILHRIFVVATIFFFVNYIALFLNEGNMALFNLLFIGVILNFTYPLVPRKSNPEI